MQLIVESGAYHIRFSIMSGCWDAKSRAFVAELMHTLKEKKSVQCLEFE
jgi:hypothetical protein